MKQRLVILSIDDIARLFKDYAGIAGGFPPDSQCETLLFNKALGKMALRISSKEWNGVQPAEVIRFELHRTHLVGS